MNQKEVSLLNYSISERILFFKTNIVREEILL
jgi:hypothetical protein